MMTKYEKGYFDAVNYLVLLMEEYEIAADLLEVGGYLDFNCSSLKDNDKQAMRQLSKKDPRCNFSGLDS